MSQHQLNKKKKFNMAPPLLDIKNLSVDFHLRRGVLTAVRDLSLSISEGETFGIVGETGCGKSVTALSILRLVPHTAGQDCPGRADL